MYEWLSSEMATVNTPKFFLVDGPAPAELRDAVEQSELPLPTTYKSFVLQFGNARLYRQGSVYLVEVFAGPVQTRSPNDDFLLYIARTDMAPAYFKKSLLVPGGESPVFEWRQAQGLKHAADTFDEWLSAHCTAARRTFSNSEWRSIREGPPPFSDEEKAIVEARRRFRWRVSGVAANGDLRFEVYNGSDLVLPYLTIGVRGRLRPPSVGPMSGGVWLPVSSIRPGETRTVEKDCYKDAVDPRDIEVFEKPDPEPEDRERYWEFK